MEPEVVKLEPRVRWRDLYMLRVRDSGKSLPGCGPEKATYERKMLARFDSRCCICKGAVHTGDWIYWNAHRGRVRHAPSGYKQ